MTVRSGLKRLNSWITWDGCLIRNGRGSKMTYKNLKTIGRIREVFPTEHVTKTIQPQLVSPEEVWLTRVWIDGDIGSRCTELFGKFGVKHLGQAVELVESYDQPENGLRRFTQQVYINGTLEVDQAIVKSC